MLCNPQELALRLWAQPATGEFLHAVCDSSHQQLAAEVPRRLSFVETTPLLTQFSEIEREEARQRLRIDNLPVGGLTDRGRRLVGFVASRGGVDGAAHGFAAVAMR